LGAAAAVGLVQNLLYLKHYDLVHAFIQSARLEKQYATRIQIEVLNFFGREFRKLAHHPLWSFIIVAGAAAILLTARRGIRAKDPRILFFPAVALCGVGLFLTVAFFFHSVEERHFVWLGAPACACAAYWIDWLSTERWSGWKIPIRVSVGFIAAFFFFQSYAVSVETFKISTITSWFEAHSILRRNTQTFWWQINDGREETTSVMVPTNIHTEGHYPPELWYMDNPAYVINWISVVLRRNLGYKYLLTSGIDTHASVGENERLLADVKPMMSWPHPYSSFRHRFFYNPEKKYSIRLYDLDEVLSAKNPALSSAKKGG